MAKLVYLKDIEKCDKSVGKIIDAIFQRYVELGISYEEISYISGVSEPTICNLFSKKKRASITSVVALVDALGLELVVRKKEK